MDDMCLQVAHAIRRAADHIRLLARNNNNHETLTKNGRIGLFVTSLRRELTGTVHDFGSICNTRLWEDVGVLSPHYQFIRPHGGGYTLMSRLGAVTDYAKALDSEIEVELEQNRFILGQLQQSLDSQRLKLVDVQRINKEADAVMDNLVKILNED